MSGNEARYPARMLHLKRAWSNFHRSRPFLNYQLHTNKVTANLLLKLDKKKILNMFILKIKFHTQNRNNFHRERLCAL